MKEYEIKIRKQYVSNDPEIELSNDEHEIKLLGFEVMEKDVTHDDDGEEEEEE